MNARILNREFQHPSDGWYQIEPKGDHPNRAASVVQVIDDVAINTIVNRFNAEADQPEFPGMLIDHEHFKHDQDKETTAYGWLMKLQNRADGIYGQVKWTATGKPAVDGGDYRFFSTEYDPADLKVLNASGKVKRIRPLRLDGLTLTNSPNNKGGKPITNRDEQFPRTTPADNQKQNERPKMKSVCTLLGLSAEADEQSVHAAVTKLLNRADISAPDLLVIKNRNAELEPLVKTLLDEQVDGILAEHGIKEEKIINRLKPVLIPLKNRADRVACLADLGHKPVAEKAAKAANGKVLNRADGKSVDESASAEAVTAAQMTAEVRKIMNRDDAKFEAAYNTLRQEKPELFKN